MSCHPGYQRVVRDFLFRKHTIMNADDVIYRNEQCSLLDENDRLQESIVVQPIKFDPEDYVHYSKSEERSQENEILRQYGATGIHKTLLHQKQQFRSEPEQRNCIDCNDEAFNRHAYLPDVIDPDEEHRSIHYKEDGDADDHKALFSSDLFGLNLVQDSLEGDTELPHRETDRQVEGGV